MRLDPIKLMLFDTSVHWPCTISFGCQRTIVAISKDAFKTVELNRLWIYEEIMLNRKLVAH